MSIHDGSFFRRPPLSPRDFVLLHSTPSAVTMVVPLVKAGGNAVLGIAYRTKFSAHPLAVYDGEGNYRRFPTEGLISSAHDDFVYSIEPDRLLRTIDDAKNLAIRWVAAYVDLPPRTRH